MNQAISRLPLTINLVSLTPPEAHEPKLRVIREHERDQPAAPSLVLYPGKPSGFLVYLENLSDRRLSWRLELDGNFPLAYAPEGWIMPPLPLADPPETDVAEPNPGLPPEIEWQVNEQSWQVTGEIEPGQTQEFTLLLQVPADYFEADTAITLAQPYLNHTYWVTITGFHVPQPNQQGSQPDRQEEPESNRRQESRSDRPQCVAYFKPQIRVRPRTAYLEFLPMIYRQVDFVQRFVALFEETFDPYVQTIDTLWAYLDPLTAPESILDFLAHWVDWHIEPEWSLAKQRRLMRHALELYRWRGTRRALRFFLHLYTDLPLAEHLPEHQKPIQIEEMGAAGFVFGSGRLGEDARLGGGQTHHFVVRLRPNPDETFNEALMAQIRKVIEREKPAFCTYDLIIEDS